jgi:hypothetical protein
MCWRILEKHRQVSRRPVSSHENSKGYETATDPQKSHSFSRIPPINEQRRDPTGLQPSKANFPMGSLASINTTWCERWLVWWMKPWWNSETHQKRTGIYKAPLGPWALGPLGPWVRERLWIFIEAAIYRISRISRFSATVHARAVGTSRDKPSEPAAGDVEVHGPRIVLHDKPRFPYVPITFRC